VKLIVPFIDKMRDVDARLIRLAEFLGVGCESLPLAKPVKQYGEYLETAVRDSQSCFVVNPSVMKEWIEGDSLPDELVSFLTQRFPHMLVHAIRPESFDTQLAVALSGGRLQGVREVEQAASSYQISSASKDVCESFAGLSFGPVNSANDRVFFTDSVSSAVRRLISIGGGVFMAETRQEKANIIFVGSEDVSDLDAEIGDAPLTEYFSRLLPHAMALRHIFGEECWRPCEQHASVIIDDPLLRPTYGFLNFERLLELMKRNSFQTTVAFIPHNFRRNSKRITRMFLENAAYFSLCFHGNDHTGAEFASADPVLLNTMLQIAEQRMDLHSKETGLECDRVMVFPQGNFSVEAMAVLRSRNFDCAVNTVSHPRQQVVRLTLGEIAQPAVLRYGGFPLFLRRKSVDTQSPDIAFNLFFGRPTFIVEHHDVFRHPECLVDAVCRINSISPAIRWSSLGTAASGAILRRRSTDSTFQVRAYSRHVRISNSFDSAEQIAIEWKDFDPEDSVAQVLKDGKPCEVFVSDKTGVRLSARLGPCTAGTFSVVYSNPLTTLEGLGFQRNVWAFLRRRLSEVRDNYVSKNAPMTAAAKMLRRRLVH
jgi:hypothetical protein